MDGIYLDFLNKCMYVFYEDTNRGMIKPDVVIRKIISDRVECKKLKNYHFFNRKFPILFLGFLDSNVIVQIF